MLGIVFPNHERSGHHLRLVLLRLRHVTRGAAGSSRRGPGERGLAALFALERRGLVRRVHSLPHDGIFTPPSPRASLATHISAARGQSHRHPHARMLLVELERPTDREAILGALAGDAAIEFASRVPQRSVVASAEPTVSIPPIRLWNHARIAWDPRLATSARRVRVAVLDTGVDATHPDLRGRIARYTWRYYGVPRPSSRDHMGHGTHVSGIIAGADRSPLGARGLCHPTLGVWKVFADTAVFEAAHDAFVYLVDPLMYYRALIDAAAWRPDVMNLSLGGHQPPDPAEQAGYDALLSHGCAIVAAMGNDGTVGSPTSYPAALPGVIAVGATTIADTVAPFSSRGRHIALCAPGEAIWSSLPRRPGEFGFLARPGASPPRAGAPVGRNKRSDAWLGTSVATPHVTAAAALLVARSRRALTPADIRIRLIKSADRLPGMRGKSRSSTYGAGRLNISRLLSL